MNSLTKEQLINIVQKIIDPETDEDTRNLLLDELERNTPHPAISNLIFYSFPEKSPEEIVNEALSYRPIVLG